MTVQEMMDAIQKDVSYARDGEHKFKPLSEELYQQIVSQGDKSYSYTPRYSKIFTTTPQDHFLFVKNQQVFFMSNWHEFDYETGSWEGWACVLYSPDNRNESGEYLPFVYHDLSDVMFDLIPMFVSGWRHIIAKDNDEEAVFEDEHEADEE